jgi:catechol 2,3-dioxygenase-like lactoylglutathione lyase family enzyme
MSLIPARVDAIALPVADVAASTRFYTETMGFEELPRLEGSYAIDGDEVPASSAIIRFQLDNLMIVIIDRRLLADEMNLAHLPAPGASSMGIRLPRAEVDHYMDRLAEAGVRVLSPSTLHGAIKIGFAADPDGHVWEIIEDPLATTASTDEAA